MRPLVTRLGALAFAVLVLGPLSHRAAAVSALELLVVEMDSTADEFPFPNDDYGSLRLNILAGERPRFGVRFYCGFEVPVPPEADAWLRTKVLGYVLPYDEEVDLYGTQQDPFAERLAAVTRVAVAQLEPDPTAAGAENAVVFRLAAGQTLAVGAYSVVVLLPPEGLQEFLAPHGAEIGGLSYTGPEFRVLDPQLEQNKPHALHRKVQQALDDNRLAEALAFADALMAHCPGSGLATVYRARVLEAQGVNAAAQYQLALQQLHSGLSPCDQHIRQGTSYWDDLTDAWAQRALPETE